MEELVRSMETMLAQSAPRARPITPRAAAVRAAVTGSSTSAGGLVRQVVSSVSALEAKADEEMVTLYLEGDHDTVALNGILTHATPEANRNKWIMKDGADPAAMSHGKKEAKQKAKAEVKAHKAKASRADKATSKVLNHMQANKAATAESFLTALNHFKSVD